MARLRRVIAIEPLSQGGDYWLRLSVNKERLGLKEFIDVEKLRVIGLRSLFSD